MLRGSSTILTRTSAPTSPPWPEPSRKLGSSTCTACRSTTTLPSIASTSTACAWCGLPRLRRLGEGGSSADAVRSGHDRDAGISRWPALAGNDGRRDGRVFLAYASGDIAVWTSGGLSATDDDVHGGGGSRIC